MSLKHVAFLLLREKSASLQQAKESILPRQQWAPYPDYRSRKNEDKIATNIAAPIAVQGKNKLHYNWQVVSATD